MLQSKKVTIATGQATAKTMQSLAANGGKPLYVGRLVGVACDTKTGTSQYGEWTALVGDFIKTTPDGETERAPQAFGPDMVISPVVGALKMGGGAVNVAVDVYVVHDEKSPVGFAYRTENVIPDQEDSPMARLLALASAKAMPALTAPAAKGKKA